MRTNTEVTPEQKLFLLPDENLFRALEGCLSIITSDSCFLEELARVAPALTGEKREPFLMALHSLGAAADRSPYDVPEVFALSGEIFWIIQERSIVASDDDAADFVEVMENFVATIYVSARQIVENMEARGRHE